MSESGANSADRPPLQGRRREHGGGKSSREEWVETNLSKKARMQKNAVTEGSPGTDILVR